MVLGDYDEVFHSALAPYDSFEGAVVWDIGAHVGYESLSFATLVGPTGRVVAFEPNLANVQEWQRNVAGNPDLAPRMEIRTTALSDVRGTAAFCVSSDVVGGASSGSHLADVTPPEASTSYEAFGLVQVECALADDLVEAGEVAPPALVKIDVEGAEANVLRGAIRTLQSHRPTLLIEVHHVRAMHDVDRVLSDVGYSVTVLESPEEIASRCFIKAVPSTLEGAGASEGPREYAVGRHTILLPAGHVLDTYQAEFPRYDIPLGEIARLVFAKRPLSAAIDVGANVGDTVALIRSFADVPVLCIEGSAEFLPLLRENAGRVGGDIDIVEAYVSDGTAVIDRGKAAQTESTSSVVDALAQDDTEGVQTRSLESILSEHPRFASSALLKIDTDGYDYPIIISSSEYLSRARPVVFFEYVTQGFGEQQEANSLEAVRTLLDGGYNRFVVYDCYGNFMVTACGIETFEELNTYLRSNRLGGVGAIRTWYLDVCAFHADDQDLFEELHRHELSLNLPEKG
jgi:FkbM family methyltransferase